MLRIVLPGGDPVTFIRVFGQPAEQIDTFITRWCQRAAGAVPKQ